MYERIVNNFKENNASQGYVHINIPADMPRASNFNLFAKEHGALVYFYVFYDAQHMDWARFDDAKSHLDQAFESIAQRVSARHKVVFNVFVGELNHQAMQYVNSTVDFKMDEHYNMFAGIVDTELIHNNHASAQMDKMKTRIENAARGTVRNHAMPPLQPPPVAPRPQPAATQKTKKPRIYYGIQDTSTKLPIVTIIIIAINVLVFGLLELNGGSTNPQTLLEFGAAQYSLVVTQGQWYRIVTSMFLHIGVMHIFMNVMWLVLAGIRAEQSFGILKFLAIYFAGGIIGALAMVMLAPHPLTIGAGASGAIFGLIGAMMARMLITKRPIATFNVQSLGIMIGINLVIGFMIPEISNTAHIGGMIAGAGVGALFSVSKKR